VRASRIFVPVLTLLLLVSTHAQTDNIVVNRSSRNSSPSDAKLRTQSLSTGSQVVTNNASVGGNLSVAGTNTTHETVATNLVVEGLTPGALLQVGEDGTVIDFFTLSGSGTTLDNDDLVTLYTYTFPATNLTAQLGAHVLGAGPTNIYGFQIAAVARNIAGTATLVGTNNTYVIPAAGTNLAAYWDVSGATARLRIRGTLLEEVNWSATNILVNVVTNGLAEEVAEEDPFDEASVSGMVFWFKANSGAGSADNDPVSTWQDSSSNNRDASQATSGKRPTYKTGIINGYPVVRFDNGDSLELAAINLSAENAVTLFVVATATESGAVDVLYEFSTVIDSPQAEGFLAYRDNNNKLIATHHGDALYNTWVSTSTHTSTFEILTFTWNKGNGGATETEVQINDSPDGANTAANDNTGTFGNLTSFIGSRNSTDFFLTGDIAEIILYDSDLSGADETVVYSYLNSKYAVGP
jgi:hypothetical protein